MTKQIKENAVRWYEHLMMMNTSMLVTRVENKEKPKKTRTVHRAEVETMTLESIWRRLKNDFGRTRKDV